MVDKILKAQKVHNKGFLFGILSSGGSFNVGNLQVEIVAKEGKFVTVQVYEYGLDVEPEKQGWVKTKKVVEKVEVFKKPEQQPLLFEHSSEVKKW